MNEYWGKLRWCFDEGSNTDIVDDIGVIDVLDVPMEKSVNPVPCFNKMSPFESDTFSLLGYICATHYTFIE